MGMAASQARLLSITARIHDVEYQAQALQNAKVQLSTQSDQAYEDYNNALNATTLTISTIDDSGQKATIAATFNNLASSSKLRASDGSNYALVYNNSLLVEDDVYKGYQDFQDSGYNQNGYHFAMFMLGIDNDKPDRDDLKEAEENVYKRHLDEDDLPSNLKELREQVMSYLGEHGKNAYDVQDDGYDKEKYEAALKAYQKQLYATYASEIFAENYTIKGSSVEEDDFRTYYSAKFNNYVDIFNQIKANGGNCRPISEFNGPSGDAANNSEWLKNMVESGVISIYTVKTDRKTGEVSFNGTSPSSDHSLNYTDTTSIDKRALIKAEAEYNKKLKDIDRKDKQYDLSLSRLETERSALTTEYDSVKKVIEDNIERTFGIFS